MRVLIAITLIVSWAALLIYALWRVAQDLVLIRYAPGSPLSDRDDNDLVQNASQYLGVGQPANGSPDEQHGDREQT
jgi:hypothetical protein